MCEHPRQTDIILLDFALVMRCACSYIIDSIIVTYRLVLEKFEFLLFVLAAGWCSHQHTVVGSSLGVDDLLLRPGRLRLTPGLALPHACAVLVHHTGKMM